MNSTIENTIRNIIHSNELLRRINQKRIEKNIRLLNYEVEEAERIPEKKISFIIKHREKYKNDIVGAEKQIQNLKARVEINDEMTSDMLFCSIGYGFTPYEYIAYNFKQKRSFEERSSFLSDREVMQIVHLCNDPEDIQIFNDKANTYDHFKTYYGRKAICIRSKEDQETFLAFIQDKQEIVVKEVNEAMGRSVELISLPGDRIEQVKLFEKLILKGQKLIIEERIRQNEKIANLNQSSVNTIRIITFNTHDGILAPYCFLKVGRNKSFVDNGGAGGLLIGVDIKTGITNTYGRDELGNVFEAHPNTGIKLKGFQLPAFEEAIALAKTISEKTAGVKYIGWDFAYTENGWDIVEGNGKSQLIGPQLTMQQGIKAEVMSIIQKLS